MSAQGKPLRCEIIHDNFQNYRGGRQKRNRL